MVTANLIDVPWIELGKRAEPFRTLIDLMPPNCVIVETGTVRTNGNWSGDGQSTVVWDQVARTLAGHVTTIDIDPIGAQLVDELGLTCTTAVTADSLEVLRKLSAPVDLLYLDSFDINFADPEPAQHHHLREIAAAWHLVRSGSIVAVDDNLPHAGKGRRVGEFLESRGAVRIVDSYVQAWRI
jgi:predicted O-methyltransferase YrrM